MSREVDRRDAVANRLTPAREERLNALAVEASDQLPGERRLRITGFDPRSGNPSAVVMEAGPAEKGNYVQRALDHVQGIHAVLGLSAVQPAEFSPDPNETPASSGALAIHLQQRYKGIRIFQAAEAVMFDADGRLAETVGNAVTVEDDRPVEPRLSVQEAVLAAARHVAQPDADEAGATDPYGEPLPQVTVDVSGYQPQVIAAFPEKAERNAVLAPGPFGDEIKAGLLWFPLGGELRLGWEVVLAMPEYNGQYRTIVDAESGEVLYCRQLIHTAIQAHVFVRDGSGPRQQVTFPRALADYPVAAVDALPAGFPDVWVTGDSTDGNSVRAHLGPSGPVLRGTVQGQDVVFQPVNVNDDDQKVLNIFYYNCFMHDFFYLLGFREQHGNFQRNNLGRGGAASDAVDARAHSGAVRGTANMLTLAEGTSPVMNMGLVTSTNRHTAFDSSVVFHEFVHGVTNRLVGGPLNVSALEAAQSGGMGEGWGDYVACTINDDTVVGAWVVDAPAGIRQFRYDDNFPDNFGDLGTGRYDEEHNIGEIWAATLLAMNRRIGAPLAMQLVVDALKLSPANPSFLDMRDAILRALDAKLTAGQLTAAAHATARTGIWAVFARFGMGPNARSNGAGLSGIVADFVPPVQEIAGGGGTGAIVRGEATPNLTIPDNQPAGIASAITIQGSGTVRRIRVMVDITHPFVGDLRVDLVAQSGRRAVLQDRSGGMSDDLVASFDSASAPALRPFVDAAEPVAGRWELQVRDLAGRDVGTLNRWSLELES